MAALRQLGIVAATVLIATMARAYPIAREGEEALRLTGELQSKQGPWIKDGNGWGLSAEGGGRRYLLDEGPTPAFVRLRISGAGGVDAALMFRARVLQTSPLRIRGYGVAIQGAQQTMSFLRWDDAGVRDPGATTQIPALQNRESLELVVWIAGSNFSATLYDGQTKESLATLAWSDTGYREGGVGLYAHPRQPTGARFQLFGLHTPIRSGALHGVSPTWTAYLPARVWQRVPAELRARINAQRAPDALEGRAGRMALMGGEVDLHALVAAGFPLEDLHAGVPHHLRRHSDGLRDWQGVHAEMRKLQRRYRKQCDLREVGRSAEGRPILALVLGNSEPSAPAWLFNGAHHANEASTPEFVLDLVRYLLEHRQEPKVRQWLRTFRIVAVPMVNPDGSHAFWHLNDEHGRKNRRAVPGAADNLGVDLNRNYPFRWGGPEARYDTDVAASDFYRGPSAASEPEVQAMVRLAERERFVGAVSYHEAATRLLVPYTIPKVTDPEPSVPWSLAKDVIAAWEPFTPRKRYEAVRALYPVSGTEQDWYFHHFGTAAFLLEVPFRRARGDKLTQSVVHARHLWQWLFERWHTGPALSVQVVRPGGAPVAAEVHVREVQLRAGERWVTHPEHGSHHQFLPQPGTYHVEVAAGGTRLVRRVEVGNAPAELTVELPESEEGAAGDEGEAVGQ